MARDTVPPPADYEQLQSACRGEAETMRPHYDDEEEQALFLRVSFLLLGNGNGVGK